MEPPTPQCVGREFVRQYYTLLNQAPLHLHRYTYFILHRMIVKLNLLNGSFSDMRGNSNWTYLLIGKGIPSDFY